MGASGPKFTWTNGRQGSANVQKRLDRGLCNEDWRAMFPEGMIQNLPRTYSDHAPLLISPHGMHSITFMHRPFRFEAAWIMDATFGDVVLSSWNGSNLREKIDNFSKAAISWNKNVFGNIFRKKRWTLARIKGVQDSQSKNFSHNLISLEKDLVADYNNILAQEELLWFQKSRAKWIVMGERNTRYFHLSTIIRRRKAKITTIKDNNNIWIEDPEAIKELVQNYFIDLFRNQNDTQGTYFLMNNHKSLSNEDNETLRIPVTDSEIWNMVRSIAPFKAPGPDGLQAIFYQKYWNIIGEDVCNFVKNCFANSNIHEEANKTLISLIPKSDNPENIKMFRPISLCNVRYKIVTKIIVARLRPLLDKIISPFQSSFIPGRSTSDNIIITQEVLHTLRSKKGKKGGILLKIDLEKAYDKISWNFLLDTLIFFNLDPSWTALIMSCVMSCVSSVKTAIIWNGEVLDDFSPGRGLRQGDPLSPYLFVLCMERLSILIDNKCEAGDWKGIKVARDSEALTHLFFADDLILFGHANRANCKAMMEVLNDFCSLSGQTVNLSKSKMFVSPNVTRRKARHLSNFCGIALTNDLGKYLGVPLLHKRTNRSHFKHIIEKVQCKLSGWKANTLHIAGRATLIQTSSSTIPSYTMQTMKFPVNVCDKLDRLNRDFLWGDTPEKKRIHLVNWNSVCKNKDMVA